MPELPEVETTRRGIAPLLIGKRILRVILRTPSLRWPLTPNLPQLLQGRKVLAVSRRAKYLLIACEGGWILIHLGMSGHLRVLPAATAVGRHDHVDIVLDDGFCLRLNDTRRFGALLWLEDDPARHPLLAPLGPEPFSPLMDGAYLFHRARGRTAAVKNFIMDQRIVVGVGNIYANEALFRAGILPARCAGRISCGRYEHLAATIRAVLAEAIAVGGTTLRDFHDAAGQPGYFTLQLQVYGKAGEPCSHCGTTIRLSRLGQRATYYCPRCQH